VRRRKHVCRKTRTRVKPNFWSTKMIKSYHAFWAVGSPPCSSAILADVYIFGFVGEMYKDESSL